MTLFEKLDAYAENGRLPMHMAGHKRNTDAFPWLTGLAERDITEIDGFDNLNDPEGLFRDLEARMARLWGADQSAALVNGSTVGILAAVLTVLGGGGELLTARDSHRSVYHAAELAKARTHYLIPARDPELGIPLSVTPEEVSAALDRWPDVRLVCVTSPTYEGVLSDIPAIANLCHRRGIPLLVDEAHGAHLGFGPFPVSAVGQGADLTVQSLHKTLPGLTQTAVLHMNRGLTDPAAVRRTLAMLQTSSPSYLLSGSIDACADLLERRGPEAAEAWYNALTAFREGLRGLRHIRLWSGSPGVFALDPSKLLIEGPGLDLAAALRERFAIEPEYACRTHLLCMTGLGDTPETLSRLSDALLSLDGALSSPLPRRAPLPLPEALLPIHEAARLPGRLVPLSEAPSRVSGEYVWSYPPGVPLIVPGERVTPEVLAAIGTADNLHSTHKQLPNSIFCVDLPGKIV